MDSSAAVEIAEQAFIRHSLLASQQWFKRNAISYFMNPLKSMKGMVLNTPLEPVARKVYVFAKGVFRRAKCYPLVRKHLSGKSGLEIGGPSYVFEINLPIYSHIQSLDNCVFAEVTHWEGARASGATFHFDQGKRTGNNFIAEGSTLERIADASYDFVLSSHNLEHIANPIKALQNWNRVLKPCGFLLLVLPDKHRTFDYRRPVTTLEHLRDDYARNMGEDDMTHVEEFVTLWDYKKYPIANSVDEHRQRYRNNFQQRLVHHHVFELKSATHFAKDCGWQVLAAERSRPNHLALFLQKP
jgi:SAM-dependent methyltransferase